MADLMDDLAKAEGELADLDRQFARLAARLTDKRAEVARLRELIAAQRSGGLSAARTEAIVAVLAGSAGVLSPSQIHGCHGWSRSV